MMKASNKEMKIVKLQWVNKMKKKERYLKNEKELIL
jgi:hypothetical protein